jgi:heterogeneous nuclear ribonucleoprotein A1/A3
MFKILVALAAGAAMGGVLIATEATAAQNAGRPGAGARAGQASVARGNGGGRATMGRTYSGRVANAGQVRGVRAGYRGGRAGYAGYGGGYGVGYAAPAYGSVAPAYGYDDGYDGGYAPAYAYGNGYGPGYAYGPGYGPVAPCLPIPLPVVGCY